MSWNDERVEDLKQLWFKGLSASQIALELGHNITRNAVIGKIHRLGLSRREKTFSRSRGAGAHISEYEEEQSTFVLTIAEEEAGGRFTGIEDFVLPSQRSSLDKTAHSLPSKVTITELRESMCRWPIGDPASIEFRFCGSRTAGFGPYCDNHTRVAYQPIQEKRREKERRVHRLA